MRRVIREVRATQDDLPSDEHIAGLERQARPGKARRARLSARVVGEAVTILTF